MGKKTDNNTSNVVSLQEVFSRRGSGGEVTLPVQKDLMDDLPFGQDGLLLLEEGEPLPIHSCIFHKFEEEGPLLVTLPVSELFQLLEVDLSEEDVLSVLEKFEEK